jgi:hypothetical protein
VWAIDTWAEHIDAIVQSGLTVSGASGSYVVDSWAPTLRAVLTDRSAN